MLEKTDLEKLCKEAIEASIEAGELIQSQVDQSYGQQEKQGGHSKASQVVTEIDFKAQAIILKHLAPSMAQHDLGLLTEEAADDESRLIKDYFWCIDPLDGTLPYTEQRPGYAVSIALISKFGDPVIGVVYVPDEDLCYSAIKGQGLYLNGESFLPKPSADISLHVYMDRSMQGESYFNDLGIYLNHWADSENYEEVVYHFGYGAVRNALSVFAHRHSCYFKFPKAKKGGGSIWDFAATRLIFEELNFPVSNYKGDKLHLNSRETTFMHLQGVVYASNRELANHLKRFKIS